MPRFILSLLALTFLSAAPSGDEFAEVRARVVEFRLENGMTWIVLPRREAPVVSFCMMVGVGGVDEPAGQTGLAHLFEHMAFKGTRTIGTTDWQAEQAALDEVDSSVAAYRAERDGGADPQKMAALKKICDETEAKAASFVTSNAYASIYEKQGADGLNAFTGIEYTGYVLRLPSNALELWMAVESERFARPVLREFYKECSVVMEERRMRTESSPGGKLYEETLAAAFKAHAYGRPVIGFRSDLEHLTRAQARAFYATYYVPNNTVVAVAGDVDSARVHELAQKYFGWMEHRPDPPRPVTTEPVQEGERRIDVETKAQPIVSVGYHIPDLRHFDRPALDVLIDVLADGATSRLHAALVKDKKLAISVRGRVGVPGSRYPGMAGFYIVPAAGISTDAVEAAAYEVLQGVIRDGVTAEEIASVRARQKMGLIRELKDSLDFAQDIAFAHTVAGSWTYLFDEQARLDRVTPEDARRVAGTYLVKRNRVVGRLVHVE